MAKDHPVIFLVDDDELYLLRLKDHLIEKLAFEAMIFTYIAGEECLANLNLEPDIVVLDYYFTPNDGGVHENKQMNGLELIARLKESAPEVHLIMLSSETDVEVANTALKEGAKDYIIKYEYAPVQLQYLISNIILNRMYNPKVNYWKWGAITIGVLFVLVLTYLVSSIHH